MGFKHQIELIMSWLIFLCLSYHEHIFEAKMEAEVRLLEVTGGQVHQFCAQSQI